MKNIPFLHISENKEEVHEFLQHLKRVEKQLKKYGLAHKCRKRWRRRHLKGLIHLAQIKANPIGEAIHQKLTKYDKLYHYVKFEKWRKETHD